MRFHARILCIFLLVFSVLFVHALAEDQTIQKQAPFIPGEVVIKWKSTPLTPDRESVTLLGSNGTFSAVTNLAETGLPGVYVVRLPDDGNVEEAVRLFSEDPDILYAEPNYLFSCDAQPNDPYFSMQWGLDNTGQTGGLKGADIDAIKAWDLSKGRKKVVIAIVDTGVDFRHEDIRANRWINKNEIPNNGIDDDLNGFVDDYFGWDFRDADNRPNDENGHGTFCAGIAGASGDNQIGIAGVNWKIHVMPVKFMGRDGFGNAVDAASAILYAKENGADIISCSWGGTYHSQLVKDAIESFPGLVICSAGNSMLNTDIHPHYPSGYASRNIIAVAASEDCDNLYYSSNYGKRTVDLAAPGDYIFSTLPRNSYGYRSGTSAAAPHVSGVAALVLSKKPNINTAVLKKAILGNVYRKDAFYGKMRSNGRLNAFKTLENIAMRIDYAASPQYGIRPLTVQFTDKSKGNIIERHWNFGDGSCSFEKNPSHVYQSTGLYTVQLRIKTPYTTKKLRKEGLIRVYDFVGG